MRRRSLAMFLIALVPAVGSLALGSTSAPERLILTGIPAWRATRIATLEGVPIPAGCGPEAARLLLQYYERRHGYRLVRDDPYEALRELHERMGTITVTWHGMQQGLTWPWSFAPGLRAYIETRYSAGAKIATLTGDLRTVFERSLTLLQESVAHVILFDWRGTGGVFPNHYAVVVGYDRSDGRRHLVVNPGWGYDFQILDMSDPVVAPASLYWIEEIRDPPDAEPGIPVDPPSAAGMWEPSEAGSVQLRPVLRLHHDPWSTVRWPPSSQVQFLVPGVGDLAIVTWQGR